MRRRSPETKLLLCSSSSRRRSNSSMICGHGDFKTFVEDYAQKMQARHNAQPAAPNAVAAHTSSAESIFAGRQ